MTARPDLPANGPPARDEREAPGRIADFNDRHQGCARGLSECRLRRLTRLPEQVPGLFDDLKTEHVDPGLVPGVAVVSAVSLIGGASLGPEKALGTRAAGRAAGSPSAGRSAKRTPR